MARLLTIAGFLGAFVTGSSAHAQEADDGDDGDSVIAGAYANVEWRVLRIGGHASHGPGFSVGASFLDGWLRIGVAGFARPGPMNPRTWDVPTSDGSTYRGSDRLTLRSDGNFVGLQVALAFEMPGLRWLAVSIPVTIGQAVFGFYLTGDDRDTPDGARVSEWENRLLDGRDSSAALGVETGVRLHAVPPGAPWIRPYLAVHYFTAIGYDAYVRSSYDGASLALGVEIGHGL